jgi:hypothetical protein
MTNSANRFEKAISAFDAYNSNDPNQEEFNGRIFPKEILYAQRMTERLTLFAPAANESVKLAARCQHIGRWEILRSNYPMDKKGYLLWRAEEKMHHAQLADKILRDSGYPNETIDSVKSLLLKKELKTNADTQLLEDIICLIFIEFYLEQFAAKHDGDKVISIIQKTMKKMSAKAIAAAIQLTVSNKTKSLLQQAASPPVLFQFETEFMKDDIRCIPMAVRFKLDACGIKLKLSEWNQFTLQERNQLAAFQTSTQEQVLDFRKHVEQLVVSRTGAEATNLSVESNPAWAKLEEIPETLLKKLSEYNWAITVSQWKALTDLQRFVLVKLSRPSHENKNFTRAVKEFGLAD